MAGAGLRNDSAVGLHAFEYILLLVAIDSLRRDFSGATVDWFECLGLAERVGPARTGPHFRRGGVIRRMTRLPSIAHTPDGRRLVVDRVVAADRDAAWDLLTDTRRWPEWGPSVTDVRSPDRYVTAGTAGEVQVAGGPWVSFRVDACEDYRWRWSVQRVPATGHFVRPADDGSRVGFEIPVWAAGYAPVCDRACSRIARVLE